MRTASAYTLSASGRTSDRGGTVAAQRFSQILSPDAPPAFEKSRLGTAVTVAANGIKLELMTGLAPAGGTTSFGMDPLFLLVRGWMPVECSGTVVQAGSCVAGACEDS